MDVDLPLEWRIAVETIRSDPLSYGSDGQSGTSNSFEKILEKEDSTQSPPIELTPLERQIQKANFVANNIQNCVEQLTLAEKKRSDISSYAELILGGSESYSSQIHYINTFVQSIDLFLPYFDSIEKLMLDFMHGVNIDLGASFENIEYCMKFFKFNENFKDSKNYEIKAQSLLNKLESSAKRYINSEFEKITTSNNATYDEIIVVIYNQFISQTESIRNLYKLCEKSVSFSSFLNIYSNTRIRLLEPLLKQILDDLGNNDQACYRILELCNKEYELFRRFFNVDENLYNQSIMKIIEWIFQIFNQYLIKISQPSILIKLCKIFQKLIKNDDNIHMITKNHMKSTLATLKERLVFRLEASELQIISAKELYETFSDLLELFPSEICEDIIANQLEMYIKVVSNSDYLSKLNQTEISIYFLYEMKYLQLCFDYVNNNTSNTEYEVGIEPLLCLLANYLHVQAQNISPNPKKVFLSNFFSMKSKTKTRDCSTILADLSSQICKKLKLEKENVTSISEIKIECPSLPPEIFKDPNFITYLDSIINTY